MPKVVPEEIRLLLQPKHYDKQSVKLLNTLNLSTDYLLQMIPLIDSTLEDKVTPDEIVESVRTVFEVMGARAPTQAAIQIFYTLLESIPKCFIKDLTVQICKELPKTRPIPKDWISRVEEKIATLGILKHAIRKELKERGVVITSDNLSVPLQASWNVIDLKTSH